MNNTPIDLTQILLEKLTKYFFGYTDSYTQSSVLVSWRYRIGDWHPVCSSVKYQR